MSIPVFYSPESVTAQIVRCRSGHELQRDTALFVGEMLHSTWGCPYCSFTDSERRVAFRAREVAKGTT